MQNEDSFYSDDVIINEIEEENQQQQSLSKNNPVIRPPNYPVNKKGIPQFESDILQKHFSLLVVGRPSSGKSHLVYEYITNPSLYYQKFHKVIFVTPNNNIGGLNVENVQSRSKIFNLKWIMEQINQFNEQVRIKYPTRELFEEKYGKGIDPLNVLLVLDDCIAEIKRSQYDPILKQLFFNRRWLINFGCLSLIITSQYYVELPKALRANLSSCIIFNCTQKDWKNIQQETLMQVKSIDTYIQSEINRIFSTQNKFLYIDIDKSTMYEGFNNKLSEQKEESIQANYGELKSKKQKQH